MYKRRTGESLEHYRAYQRKYQREYRALKRQELRNANIAYNQKMRKQWLQKDKAFKAIGESVDRELVNICLNCQRKDCISGNCQELRELRRKMLAERKLDYIKNMKSSTESE